MSALNKMMGYLGLIDSEEEAGVSQVPARQSERAPRESARSRRGVTLVDSTNTYSSAEVASPLATAYHIITLQPRSYSEARRMGEHYREGNPVIINLMTWKKESVSASLTSQVVWFLVSMVALNA